ncbi:MAG: hypothetical protein HS104_20915 [Polyangiaceae bacterium]|nr:hypothetical protein [Polyangiaceae bacterium]MCE7888331.1 hypothetical protein [Sorangiineae bacterium PRO1]MCL4749667.1 hypothetical protein [Myxococcales bacterium]
MVLGDPLLVVGLLVRAFDELGIRYVVGGSVASSVYGVPRSTQDVDVVAELFGKHVDPFVAALRDDFYVDADMIRDALARQSSFNVVHLKTMFKADVFVFKRDPWMTSEMNRARVETLDSEGGPLTVRFASPEDTLLHKLVWYRLGNEISERQWGDVRGIVEIQGERLDRGYLATWSGPLGVADLLERALSDP